jgi:hypothetical protein
MGAMPEYGLGRRIATDPRDTAHLMSAVLPPPAELALPDWKYWYQHGWWGNQNGYPKCVAYGFLHGLEDGPITHSTYPAPLIDPDWLYKNAQANDEWEGEDYDGTSVRAGAKVLQGLGIIREYLWARNTDEIEAHVMTRGPVVMGTEWWDSMFEPNPTTGIVEIRGSLAGYHCWVTNGRNRVKKLWRAKNSYSRGWGKQGNFWIPDEVFDQLMADPFAEACTYTEEPGWQRRIAAMRELVT